MSILIKLQWESGNTRTRLPKNTNLGDLRTIAANETGWGQDRIELWLADIPSKEIVGNDNLQLADLGVTSGSMIHVRIKQVAIVQNDEALIKQQNELPLVRISEEHENAFLMLQNFGIPPKLAKHALKVTNGNFNEALEFASASIQTFYRLPCMFARHIRPDNSCLFNAVGCVLERKKNMANELRKVISESVMADQETFNTAILGRPPEEYCSWILDETKWGGEIELLILSKYYECEICSIEIRSLYCYHYGEDMGYSRRVFLLYNGVHYDAIVEVYSPTQEDSDITIFDANDKLKMEQAMALARNYHEARIYVDNSPNNLSCLICGSVMEFELEAYQHASQTGHHSFGKI